MDVGRYFKRMNRQEIIARLRAHQAELQRQGVVHAALFGSIARGDNSPSSDIDIMIDLDPQANLDVFGYAGLKRRIAALFDGEVDVVDRAALRSWVKDSSTADAIYAF